MVGRKNYVFGYFVLESDKTPQEMFQKCIDPLYIGPDWSFYNSKKLFKLGNPDLISKSSSFTLDSSGRMIVQYALHTLYTTQKHKIKLQKRIDPLCIVIVYSFYVFEN